MGVEYFENNHDFDELRDPIVPPYFLFVFNSFIELNSCSGEQITWTDINNYAILRNIKFTQIELDLILKCISWSNSQIKELRNKE